MMDPQKYGNKFLSLVMDIVTKNSKGGIMAEKDAFDDIKDAQEKWAQPDGIVFMRPGALSGNKIKEKPQVALPPGLDRLVSYFLDSVHEVTGVNLELLGMANREQAGVLEDTRKKAGITIIAPLFDALRRYRKEQGRVLLHFIKTYLSDGRLIRINGPSSAKYVQLIREEGVSEYDIIVDESPSSPNMKEKVFAAAAQLMPQLLKAGIPIPPEVLDYTPLPSSLVEPWKALLEQQRNAVDPKVAAEQSKKMQEEMQRLTEENKALKDTREQDAVKLQMEQQKMKMQADLAQQKANQDFQLEQQKIELARWKAEQELALQREKAEGEAALQADKAEAEVSLASQRAEADLGMTRMKMDSEHSIKMEAMQRERDAIDGEKMEPDGKTPKKAKKRKVTVQRDSKTGDITGAEIEG